MVSGPLKRNTRAADCEQKEELAHEEEGGC
jgi:hypothetical protein